MTESFQYALMIPDNNSNSCPSIVLSLTPVLYSFQRPPSLHLYSKLLINSQQHLPSLLDLDQHTLHNS